MTGLGWASLVAVVLAMPASSDPANKAKTHGYPLTGTVVAIDQARKTFIVRNDAGKETRLSWTAATSVIGGKLSAGARVTLRYLDKDGKHIAMTVSVADSSAATTPPPATPSPGSR
jgi:hypothetical protein